MRPLFRFAGVAAVLASASAFACCGGCGSTHWLPNGWEAFVLLIVVMAAVVLVPAGLLFAVVAAAINGSRAMARAIEDSEDASAKALYVSGDWRTKPATK